MVDLALILYSFIGAVCVAVPIVLWTNRDLWWPRVRSGVSSVSASWQAMLDRGRAQKARREQLYGWASYEEPAAVRSGSRTGSESGSGGSGDPVRGQQNHLEPANADQNEPAREPTLRQLSKNDLIVLLAVQRKDDGSYVWSANDITKFVGGTADPIKKTIAAVRGQRETPKPTGHIERPANGW